MTEKQTTVAPCRLEQIVQPSLFSFSWFRVMVKLTLSKDHLINSFCKNCGRDIHDFIVTDETWEKISPMIRFGNSLCYDCFCEACGKAGLLTVWQLHE